MGVCALRGSFDLENKLDWLWGPTGCIDKVLTDVHKKFDIFHVGIPITKKWCAIAHENNRNRSYAHFELAWPWKWVGLALISNHLHNQGIDGPPQKWGICAFWVTFDLQKGSYWPWCPNGCIAMVLIDVQKKFCIFDVGIWVTKKMMVLLHTKIIEMESMRASGLVWPWKWVRLSVSKNQLHSKVP